MILSHGTQAKVLCRRIGPRVLVPEILGARMAK